MQTALPILAAANMSGFGRFTAEVDEPAGEDLAITFTLANDSAFPFNANDGNFTVQIRYSDHCGLFVSNANKSLSDGGLGCITETTDGGVSPTDFPVPEDSTLLLFSTGLIEMSRFARKLK